MLEVGMIAPDFTLKGINEHSEEIEFTLNQYKNKNIILYFYPKDDTPGCTTEACNFNDNINTIKNKDTIIIGISKDSIQNHIKFQKKFHLNYILLSDPNNHVTQLYDSYGEKKFMGKAYMGILRNSFIINKKGVITHIFKNVNAKNHINEILPIVSTF